MGNKSSQPTTTLSNTATNSSSNSTGATAGQSSMTSGTGSASSSAANPLAMQAYADILARAQGVAATPFSTYGGEMVAPLNPQQNLGIAGINANANFALPYIQKATDLATAAGNPIDSSDINRYLSPYTQKVVDATQAQFDNENARVLQQVKGSAIANNSLGGNREAIAEATAMRGQKLAQDPIIAGLYDKGYNSATATALAGKNTQVTGANLLGNLGVVGQNSAMTGAGAELGAGTLGQQTKQQSDTAAYQQFLNQLAYPFQTTQWLAGIGTGVGSQMGGLSQSTGTSNSQGVNSAQSTGQNNSQSVGNSQGVSYGPAPSVLGQVGGALTSGAGLLGATGAFGSAGWLAPALAMLASGGAVPSSGVANRHHVTPESDDTLHAQRQQLIDGHRRVHMFPVGTREIDMPEGMHRTERNGDVFHFNPHHISAAEIHHLSDTGRENEMLDLGPYSKEDVFHRMMGGEVPLAVVERRPDGTEVRAAAGTHTTAHHQLAHMHRTKSPGNHVGLEDPRETIGARLRGQGGRIQGFDGGGTVQPADSLGQQMVLVPYGGGYRWVPANEITRRPPPARQPQGVAMPSLEDQAKQISRLTQVIQSGSFGPSTANDQDEPAPRWSGGGVAPRGYADGGSPMPYTMPGVASWIPSISLTHGSTIPAAAGVAPPPTPGLMAAQAPNLMSAPAAAMPSVAPPTSGQLRGGISSSDLKNLGGLGRSIADAIRNPTYTSTQNEGAGLSADVDNPTMFASGGVVHGYADGGAPYDENYFDETFYNPLLHGVAERETLMSPALRLGYNEAATKHADVPQGFQPYFPQVAETPVPVLPRPRPAGVVDLPPEITAGTSRPAPSEPSTALAFDRSAIPDAPAARPLPSYDPDRPERSAMPPRSVPIQAPPPPPPEAPVAAGVAPAKGVDWSANSNLWPALIAAGAGMMASKSPYAGVAIGEGIAGGLKAHTDLRMNDQKIALEAKKLEQEAAKTAQALKIATMPYEGMTAFEKTRAKMAEEAEARKKVEDAIKMRTPVTAYETRSGLTVKALPQVNDKGGIDLYLIHPDGSIDDKPWKPGSKPVILNNNAAPAQPPVPVPPNATPPEEPNATAAPKVDPQSQEGVVQRAAAPPASPAARDEGFLARLATEDPQYAKMIKAIANYEVNPNAVYAMKGNRRERAVTDVRTYDPTYNSTMFPAISDATKKFYSGPRADTIRSFNVAMHHLDVLDQARKVLDNGDIAAINSLKNTLKTQFGYEGPVEFNSIKQIVGDEVLKAILGSGSGALADRETLAANLSTALSSKTLERVIKRYQQLMAGQLIGFKKQYEFTTRLHNFDDQLDAPTVKLLNTLSSNHDTLEKPKVTTQKQFDSLAPGTFYITKDGKTAQKPMSGL